MSKLDIISLGLVIFAVLVIVLGIIKIHTYPGKIAEARNHPQTKAIEVTSLLGLIAFPLWMFALMWAYSNAVIGKIYREEDPEVEKPAKPLPNILQRHKKQAKADDSKATEGVSEKDDNSSK